MTSSSTWPDPDCVARPADRFTFGLWTIGNDGSDVAGGPTRGAFDIEEIVGRLGELGVYGVSYHDDDLVRQASGSVSRTAGLGRFQRALLREGLVATMATTSLAGDPMFKDGALTAPNRPVRRRALAKILDAVDVAAELGVGTFVYWGARDGSDSDVGRDPLVALDRYRDGINAVVDHIHERRYPMRLALEPQPTETRGHVLLPTTGHALAFITSLDRPELVGVNPEVGHEQMSGLNSVHAVAMALWHDKLFHIDLNAQQMGRNSQELRFGSENLKEAFLLVDLLTHSGYDGPKNFDAHPYRTTSQSAVWRFAAACMHNYLILERRARNLREHPEFRRLVSTEPTAADPLLWPGERPAAVRDDAADPSSLGAGEAPWEDLDQLAVQVLLGDM